MPTRDYYLILGISRNECADGIREAFREMALKYHPDRAGPGSKVFFQDIIEAYRTLSDPAKRASYDQGLDHGSPYPESSVEKKVRYGTPCDDVEIEPLLPERGRYHVGSSFPRSMFEDIFENVLGSFLKPSSGSRRARPLNLLVELTEMDAWRGVVCLVELPVFWPCEECKGCGRKGLDPCSVCDESGLVEERRTVRVPIPAGVRDRSVLNLSVRGLGVHNLYLSLHIRVKRSSEYFF